MAWKPDFTKKDPWEGMPPDYRGIATFVPTVAKPVPPWEGQVGAEAIPTFGTPGFQDLAQRITYTPSVTEPVAEAAKPAIIAVPVGKESKIFTQAEWERAGLTSAPREWEAEGFMPWYYDTPDGRQLALEDIARSRAASARPRGEYEGLLPQFAVPPEYAEPFKALPAAKPGIAEIDWSKWVVPALVAILVLARRQKR